MFSAGFGLDVVEWGISNVGYNWRIGCLAVYRFGQVQSKIRVVISLLLFGCFASWVLFCAELKFFVSVEFHIHYVSIFFRLKMLSFFFLYFFHEIVFPSVIDVLHIISVSILLKQFVEKWKTGEMFIQR